MARMTYQSAGVDIEAGEALVERIKPLARATTRPGVMGGIGGFAALFDPKAAGFRDPVLVSSTDGVGTKLKLAVATGKHSTVGIDLVAMSVNDCLCAGAEPLFFLDYVAVGRLDPPQAAELVSGVAAGCREAGCALVGGETAEHPGLLGPDEYDVAGSTTGVVEAAALLGPGRVRAGDVVLAMASSGLHSNGYSLVRHVLLGSEAGAGWSLDRHVDELGRTLGEELLEPTTIYAKACLDLARNTSTHAMSHVTGGGLAANLERVLPDTVTATLDRGTWTPAPIFDLVRRVGSVEQVALERTLNCGVGMVAVTAPEDVDRARSLLEGHGVHSWVCGEISAAGGAAGDVPGGTVTMRGTHPGW